jgi:O-acetyl-ADP-ribose deacetylase (regulator of RNase III)
VTAKKKTTKKKKTKTTKKVAKGKPETPSRSARPRSPAEVAIVEVREGALVCAPGDDTMGFEIRWSPPTTDATLKTLRDNLRLVASNVSGRGRIALRYCATAATVHGLDWILVATKPVTALVASAQVNGGVIQTIAKAAGPQIKWSGTGVAK